MKKKILALFCGVLFITGCSDATTQVNDKNSVLIKVGDEEITKGDLYTALVAQGNITPIETRMYKILVDKLVPVTEELEKEAKEKLDGYKETYGDEWEKAYKDAGYESEEVFYNDVVLLNARVSKLTELFVADDFNALAKEFKPRKAAIIEVSDVTKAEEALAAAKEKDSDFAEVAKTYGTTTTYKGEAAIYNTNSGLSDVLWNNIVGAEKDNTVIDKVLQDTTSGTYYIVKVINVDPSKFKEEAITSITKINIDTTTDANGNTPLSLADQAFVYFLNKYDYSIHDINIYQILLASSKKFQR